MKRNRFKFKGHKLDKNSDVFSFEDRLSLLSFLVGRPNHSSLNRVVDGQYVTLALIKYLRKCSKNPKGQPNE